MKSKIIQPSFYDGKTVTHVPFYKKVLDKDNMRGYQLVIHGYFVSCMVFFFV
jgi:predicted deacetylase